MVPVVVGCDCCFLLGFLFGCGRKIERTSTAEKTRKNCFVVFKKQKGCCCIDMFCCVVWWCINSQFHHLQSTVGKWLLNQFSCHALTGSNGTVHVPDPLVRCLRATKVNATHRFTQALTIVGVAARCGVGDV